MTTIVPILTREMLAAARRRSTYAARVLVGVGSVGLAMAMLLAGFLQYLAPTAAGRMFFAWLTAIGYGFALFNGVLSTCDCISREKREGTLGLLFLTQLNAFDVVFGKFIPRFFHLCYCLLAAAPSLAFVFILGGVTAGDFCVAALNLANALFFFAALGMLISTFSRDEKRVFSAAIGLAVLLGIVLPACGTGFRSLGAGSSQVFTYVSGPAGVLNAWFNAPGTGSAQGLVVGWAFWVNHLLAWLFLLISSGCLSRMVRDTGAGESVWYRFFTEPVRWRSKRRPAKPRADSWWEVNPVYQMVTRFDLRHSSPTGRFLILFLTLAAALFAFPSIWIYPEGWRQNQGFPAAWFAPPIFPAAVVLCHYLLKFAVAAEACHALGSERRLGTLEPLLVTPAGEEVIVRGQLLALKRRYAFPVLLVLGFQALLTLTGLPRLGPGEQLIFVGIVAAATVWLFVDLYALAWVGLWCGLRASHTSQAIRQTLAQVLVLPWALLLAGGTLVALGADFRFVPGCLAIAGFPGLFGATLVGNLAWSIYSLGERFREVASTPALKPGK